MVLKIFDIENMLDLRDPYFFFNAILLYLDLQQCCVEHFTKTRKYLNAILLYLDLQQCCVEHFSKIKKILECNSVVSRDTTVLH